MNWVLTPAWGLRVIALIGIGLLLLAVWRWWNERRARTSLGLRAVAIAILIGILLNPQALLPRERIGQPKLMVLLDTSASMATRDLSGGSESRSEAAGKVLFNASTIAALEKEFVVEARQFDRRLSPLDLRRPLTNAPTGDATDLGTAVMAAVTELSQSPSQTGILVVSDGRSTGPDPADAAHLALARSVPLWTWTLGGPVLRRDLWMETASSEALAFAGAEVELAATLHAAGYANRSFQVELLQGDRVVETRTLVPDTNGVARLAVKVKAPASGEQRYVFRATPLADEADTSNNERAVFLRSVGEKVRILVAEGQPHWDTKFLVQALKQDPNVDLTAVYRLNANRHVALLSSTGTETRVEKDLFPRTTTAMEAFDVILLGRGAESFFDDKTEGLLTEFVSRRGGTVVFARGKSYGGRFPALAKFEPLAWGEGVTPAVRLRPTEAGRDNPMFDLGAAGTLDELLEKLPALDQAGVTLGEKPLAVVLASANSASSGGSTANGDNPGAGPPVSPETRGATADGPVMIAYQRYGQGKALSLNAGGLWRWAFRETGQEQSEVAYRRFWISLLQWLMSGTQFLPGSDVALTSARRQYTSEQPMQFLISTRQLDRAQYRPQLIISNVTRNLTIEPRARGDGFAAEAGPFPPGTYQVTLRGNLGQPRELTQSIEVVSASTENRELSADPSMMARLSTISGGLPVSAADVARLPEVIRRWESSRQLSHRQQPIWDRGWLLFGALGLLGLEWWFRRREGLL